MTSITIEVDATILETVAAHAAARGTSPDARTDGAHALNAPAPYTEDPNHGQRYGAVRVVNPFRPN